ncbi:MAG: hypothetical protein AUK63_1801 [bacterium P3]|nr:MAG: hypothetical protein AUK63_1801 [bacterium P3]KWW38621.1 MAG: hypothetical protein F083_2210 [bacterium F083]
MNKTYNIRKHCPEVENLMSGKLPFITKYGITVVLFVLIITVAGLLEFGVIPKQLMLDILDHTIEQLKIKNM